MSIPLEGDTLRLRYPILDDFVIWAGAFSDWPADEQGVYTVKRAGEECFRAIQENLLVTEPLTDASRWTQTLVVELLDGTPVGLHRAQAIGRKVKVLNQAFIPKQRSKGYFNELQDLLQTYLFGDLKGQGASFDLLPEAAAALAHIDGRDKYLDAGVAIGATGKPLLAGEITKDSWLAGSKK